MLIMNVSFMVSLFSHLAACLVVAFRHKVNVISQHQVYTRETCARFSFILHKSRQVKTYVQYAYTFNNFNFLLSPKETTCHPLDIFLAGPSDASSVSSGSASPSGSATYYNEWD